MTEICKVLLVTNQILDLLEGSGMSLDQQIVASETSGKLLRASPYGYEKVKCSVESSEAPSQCPRTPGTDL